MEKECRRSGSMSQSKCGDLLKERSNALLPIGRGCRFEPDRKSEAMVTKWSYTTTGSKLKFDTWQGSELTFSRSRAIGLQSINLGAYIRCEV